MNQKAPLVVRILVGLVMLAALAAGVYLLWLAMSDIVA